MWFWDPTSVLTSSECLYPCNSATPVEYYYQRGIHGIQLRRDRDGDKGHDVHKHNAERFSRSCVSAFGVLIKSFEIFEYI